MDQETSERILDLVEKTSRIQSQIEANKELLERIEAKLTPMVDKVEKHSLIINGMSWFIGIIVSVFTAKFFGKF